MGNKLLKSSPELQEVKDTIERLVAEQAAIARGWKEKELWLQQCLQLQMFNKEADNIDAVTSAHQAFLEFSDLGVSFFLTLYSFIYILRFLILTSQYTAKYGILLICFIN